jgi:hypothetical protein
MPLPLETGPGQVVVQNGLQLSLQVPENVNVGHYQLQFVHGLNIDRQLNSWTTLPKTAMGMDFDNSKVSQIVKGQTTPDELVAMFGPPSSKEPVTGLGETWTYYYCASTVKNFGLTPGGALAAILLPGPIGIEVAVISAGPSVTVHEKTLKITIGNKRVVVDFAFSKS